MSAFAQISEQLRLHEIFFLMSQDKLTIGFDGRFCLKINAAVSHLAVDPCFLPCLQRRIRSARQLGVWHSFDGPCILVLNYSVWDMEKWSSFDSHKKLALILHAMKSIPQKPRRVLDLLAGVPISFSWISMGLSPVWANLLWSLFSKGLVVWNGFKLRV